MAMNGGAAAAWYCERLVKYYRYLFVFYVALVVGIAAWMVGGYGLFVRNSPAGVYDWNIAESEQSQFADALRNARNERDTFSSDGDDDDNEVKAREKKWRDWLIVYQHLDPTAGNASIFTPETLLEMCLIENLLLNDRDYGKYCFKGSSSIGFTEDDDKRECAKQDLSILSLYYVPWRSLSSEEEAYFSTASKSEKAFAQIYSGLPTIYDRPPDAPDDEDDIYDGHARKCGKLSEAYVEARTEQLIDLVDYTDDARSILGFFFSKTVEENDTSELTRSSVHAVGTPLEGYTSVEDRQAEQLEELRPYYERLEQRFWDYFGMVNTNIRSGYRDPARTENLNIRYFPPWAPNFEFDRIVNNDLLWVSGSLLFVLFYISIYTTSAWLGVMGMFQIFMSLPLAFLPYRVIGGIEYFQQLHTLTIYLVLGIGADDCFVYGSRSSSRSPSPAVPHLSHAPPPLHNAVRPVQVRGRLQAGAQACGPGHAGQADILRMDAHVAGHLQHVLHDRRSLLRHFAQPGDAHFFLWRLRRAGCAGVRPAGTLQTFCAGSSSPCPIFPFLGADELPPHHHPLPYSGAHLGERHLPVLGLDHLQQEACAGPSRPGCCHLRPPRR